MPSGKMTYVHENDPARPSIGIDAESRKDVDFDRSTAGIDFPNPVAGNRDRSPGSASWKKIAKLRTLGSRQSDCYR